MSETQMCVACSKTHPLKKNSCECGHVLRDMVPLQNNRLRKRSEKSIDMFYQGRTLPIAGNGIKDKKAKHGEKESFMAPETYADTKKVKMQCPKVRRKRKTDDSKTDDVNLQKKVKQFSENEAFIILEEIKNSSKNIYFKKSKKYKPAKLHELNFEFDFSLFDSKCPYYPNALDDINSKIQRDKCFWKAIL